MVVRSVIERAFDVIDCELEIIRMELEFPKRLAADPARKAPDFDLRLADRPANLGIIGIAEIVAGVWLSKEIVEANGKPVSLVRLARTFEYMLGVNFGDIYKQLEAIFKRKPFNRTKALDFLRGLLIRKEKESKMGR